jgi:hypothetical protein
VSYAIVMTDGERRRVHAQLVKWVDEQEEKGAVKK